MNKKQTLEMTDLVSHTLVYEAEKEAFILERYKDATGDNITMESLLAKVAWHITVLGHREKMEGVGYIGYMDNYCYEVRYDGDEESGICSSVEASMSDIEFEVI